MGVLGKALQGAVLVSVVCGCATTSTQDGLGESASLGVVTEANSDSGIQSNETDIATTSPVSEIADAGEISQIAADSPAQVDGVTLRSVTLATTGQDAGKVKIDLSSPVAFAISQTAPSEYVLTVPGATALPEAISPIVAPIGASSIRSVRLTQNSDAVLVRMFVEEGTEITAKPAGNSVLVEAKTQLGMGAGSGDARAQLDPAAAQSDETARQNPTGFPSADGSKIYTGRLISLDLQDTDIDNALRIIAEVSNLNIIASDDVAGKVTLRLIDVPWDQALDVILKTNGLDQVTEGSVIRIAPIDKLRLEREALREAKRAAENLEDTTVRYLRVSYAKATDLQEQIQAVLSERGTVTIDDRTNQLIIKDISQGQESALNLIKKLDLRTPQVLLETQIVEGSRNILRDLGFQWNFSYVQSPATGNATGYNFPNSIGVGGGVGGDDWATSFPAAITDSLGSAVTAVLGSADGSKSLAARVSALETEGKVKVVSRPQIATINNKEAQIRSVETVRIRLPDSGTSVATGAGASASGGGSTAFEEVDVGIELTVTPQASPDYYVLLDVNAKSSTFGARIVDDVPSTLEREATSTILVKSGQTFALGGVYRIEDKDNLEGVPFLKDIPVLGVFFRRSLTDKKDEELIFFITPHIVEGSFDAGTMEERAAL